MHLSDHQLVGRAGHEQLDGGTGGAGLIFFWRERGCEAVSTRQLGAENRATAPEAGSYVGNQAYVALSAAVHGVALHAAAPLLGLAVANRAHVEGGGR